MSKNVIGGGVLEIPGSTAQGLLRKPLEGFALVLDGVAIDEGRVLVEGDLDELVTLLGRLHEEARWRRDLVEAAKGLGEEAVFRGGMCFTVPASRDCDLLSTDEVWRLAVRVDENPPSGL